MSSGAKAGKTGGVLQLLAVAVSLLAEPTATCGFRPQDQLNAPSASAAETANEQPDTKSQRLQELYARRLELTQELSELEREITAIEREIAKGIAQESDFVQTSLFEALPVFEEPSFVSKKLFEIPVGEKFFVMEPLTANWWPVKYKQQLGFAQIVGGGTELFDLAVRKKERLQRKRQAQEEAQREAEEAARKAQREAEEAARQAKVLEKYGSGTGRRIADREIWVGMTKEMAVDSRGRPDRLDRTVVGRNVIEIWYYESAILWLLRFENGQLVGWTESY
jgi:hypothetical protein